MARDESDREDLLREATAFVERMELCLAPDGSADIDAAGRHRVVVGFRASGAASFYFDADPVYQFNVTGELRRAFYDGQLIKAVAGRLVALERRRHPRHVELVSRELTPAEQHEFIERMIDRLRWLTGELAANRLLVTGQVPADADVQDRLRRWLAAHDKPAIANSPRVNA